MAKVSRTRKHDFSYKKTYSVCAAQLSADMFSGTDDIVIYKIPEGSLITNVYTNVSVAGTTATLAVNGKGTSIMAAITTNMNAVAVKHKNHSPPLVTTAEYEVTVTPSAAITEGIVSVVVEYLEPTLSCGERTHY